jgi:hypothetical protein
VEKTALKWRKPTYVRASNLDIGESPPCCCSALYWLVGHTCFNVAAAAAEAATAEAAAAESAAAEAATASVVSCCWRMLSSIAQQQ